jgi:hypothetical protein
MSGHDRSSWWMNRVGRFAAVLTAMPGLGGALADRVPGLVAGHDKTAEAGPPPG